MEVIHKNNLSAYLSDWREKIEMMNKLSKKGKHKPYPFPKTFQAIFIQTLDLSVVLRYLDLRLKILENNKLPFSEKYQDYADAIVFLKATYMFYQILLETLAVIIRYFYEENEGIKLPHKLFLPPGKGKKMKKIPKDLSDILNKVYIWFPQVEKRRGDLVHGCESFLILFERNKGGMNILKHSNIPYEEKIKNFGEIRKYIGFLLCVYQQLIDDLLDHFDSKFESWYGAYIGKAGRTSTLMEWNSSSMLWWAVNYGGYKNPDLELRDNK